MISNIFLTPFDTFKESYSSLHGHLQFFKQRKKEKMASITYKYSVQEESVHIFIKTISISSAQFLVYMYFSSIDPKVTRWHGEIFSLFGWFSNLVQIHVYRSRVSEKESIKKSKKTKCTHKLVPKTSGCIILYEYCKTKKPKPRRIMTP